MSRASYISRITIVALFIASCIGGTAHTAARDPIAVRLLTPPIGAMQWVERTTGQLSAPRRATLRMKVNGVIDHIAVNEGDRVKQGQVLATLELTDANLTLDQATSNSKAIEAQIAAARAGLETARVGKTLAEVRLDTANREYERAKALRTKDTIPQQQFDQIEGAYRLAQAGVDSAVRQIQQAQAALEATQSQLGVAGVGIRSANKRIADSALVAPFDGLVVSKTMMDHEDSRDQTLTLVDDSNLELVARLPERLLPVIGLGTRVTLRSPIVPGAIMASITTIIPSVDQRNLTFAIKAVIANADHRLNHGGYVDVEVIVREDAQVPLLPGNIVQTAADAAAAGSNSPRPATVFTVRDGRACRIPVTIGIAQKGQVAVLAGLASGTPIVDQGSSQLDDGTPVTVVPNP